MENRDVSPRQQLESLLWCTLRWNTLGDVCFQCDLSKPAEKQCSSSKEAPPPSNAARSLGAQVVLCSCVLLCPAQCLPLRAHRMNRNTTEKLIFVQAWKVADVAEGNGVVFKLVGLWIKAHMLVWFWDTLVWFCSMLDRAVWLVAWGEYWGGIG